MTQSLRRALIGLAIAFVLIEGLIIGVLVDSPYTGDKGELHEFAPLIALTFFATGLFAWVRRPENRLGPLMVAVAFSWLAATLVVARTDGLYIAGLFTFLLPYAVLIHILIVFPSGRAQGRVDRLFIGLTYLLTVGLQALLLLVYVPHTDCSCGLPVRSNPLSVWEDETVYDVLTGVQSVLAIVSLIALGWLLSRRWRRAATPQRHVLAPVYGAGAVIVVTLIATLVADLTDFSDDVESGIDITARIAMACVPFGFLAGLVRARLSRASKVSELVGRLSALPERGRSLRDALADALGDPGLALAFRVGDGYVDGDGRPLTLPADGCTPVERDGRRVGAIVHDPALTAEDPAALGAVAGAVALALENERLDAELRARIEDLRRSRARIVATADAERRRLERDLHDGAQQRLVALALTLKVARNRAGDPDAVRELLDEAATELAAATSELRELARGLHPAVLADRGLGPAIDTLAGRSAVPVEVTSVPDERLPAPIEAAAYFLIAEALTNVARYADASHAEVSVARHNGSVTVEVRDDGRGGADPATGSGLRGLADRVSALDGRLEVASPPGAGTTVTAVLPCG